MSQHLSRPHLNLVDAETRTMIGPHIDFEPPGICSALLAMQQAIQSAEPWDSWGRPAEILTDRSDAFQPAWLQRVMNEIKTDTTPESDPQA